MPNEQATDELIEAVHAILRPLVRQLIAHGLTFPAFARIGKEVYIEVGTEHFALSFKKQTDSRVALVTGITRKEIGQIRRGQSPRDATSHMDYGLATRVISRWVTEQAYRGADGEPRSLPYEAPAGTPSFVGLVDEVGGDIPPRAVVDELIRVGTAELTSVGDVRLLQRAYIPARGEAEKFAILGADASELIATITHNIGEAGEAAFLQRKVSYDNIGAAALPVLRAKVREAGAELLQAMNELFASYDRDRNSEAPGGSRKHAVLGLYYLDEDYAPQGSPDRKDTDTPGKGRRPRSPR